MMAKTITGVEIRSTQRRVRDVISKSKLRRLTPLQPLYGINRTAVDAKLEIQGCRACRCRADPAEPRAGVAVLAPGDFDGPEVAVEGIVITAVIENDEVSEAAECVGVIDRSRMHRRYRRSFRRTDFDAVSGDTPRTCGGAEGRTHPAGHGPFQRTPKGPNRNRDGSGGPTGWQPPALL